MPRERVERVCTNRLFGTAGKADVRGQRLAGADFSFASHIVALVLGFGLILIVRSRSRVLLIGSVLVAWFLAARDLGRIE